MNIEFKEYMEKLLKEINIMLDEEQLKRFFNFMNLLLEWNEKINLTAITSQDDIILKHFIDSLTAFKYIKPNAKIIDVGTGGGFPGIPLAIMCENNNFTLVDSLNKRINFLNIAKEKLNLKNIECIHSRAEDLGQNIEYREKFDIAVSRAVANLTVLVEYLIPMVKVGGEIICMKGNKIEEEINDAKNAIKELGGNIKECIEFNLPESDIKRTFIIIEKINVTPKKYPRKAGIPAKMPLK